MLDETPDAVPMAGGLDVVNRLKEGGGSPAIVWLGGVTSSATIEEREGDLVCGCLVRHDQMARSPAVKGSFPDLAAAWAGLANIRVRCQGTVVGNILAQMPGYEAAILLGATQGRLIGLRPGGEAFEVPVRALAGPDGSARACPGLVTGFRIPLPSRGCSRRLAYDRSMRPALSVALCLDLVDGRVASAQAALGGTHAQPILRPVPAQGFSPFEVERMATDLARAAFSDLPPCTARYNGREDYRPRIAPVLLARLLKDIAR